MIRRSSIASCTCGTVIIGYVGGDECPSCGVVVHSE